VDFTNVVVVMTSNLGSQFLLDAMEELGGAGKPTKRRASESGDAVAVSAFEVAEGKVCTTRHALELRHALPL
jgi:ATP-dependent Clp protease ATP-binding subunit ClpA